MKISKIHISNYRLHKDTFLSVEDDLSVIIGKNNTGKTSLLHILQAFITNQSNTFNFEDFNVELQTRIVDQIRSNEPIDRESYEEFKLILNVFIEWHEEGDLRNVYDLLLDLDPALKTMLLSFSYGLDYEHLMNLKTDFQQHHIENIDEYLKKHHRAYFKISRRVVDISDDQNIIDLEFSRLQKIINLQTISAKRDVHNEDGDSTKSSNSLSKLSYRYFKPFENSNETHVVSLQKELIKADHCLSTSYESIFERVTEDIARFSYTGSKIFVKSNFKEMNLLRENTSVVYDERGVQLPEDYNGLGYMNLFAMIFELHIIFDDFKKTHLESEPANINLLFIEEPEAHTHPQMQYVFIKNIKQFIHDHSKNIELQSIISTHSAHIVSQCEFQDIKYFLDKNNRVEIKNLADLERDYTADDDSKRNFKFLKQYLTLHRSELFFSDKIIFIEGDTERILLPAIMQKLDLENAASPGYLPLLSQKISLVEVGAHSKVFDKILGFLEIKTLVITDIDSCTPNENGKCKKCKVSEGTDTSNASIKHYLAGKSWDELKVIRDEDRIVPRGDANIYLAYQSEEEGYHARSFEDAYVSLNLEFIIKNKDTFSSIKNAAKLDVEPPDYFTIADDCIKKKTDFAIDVLYYSADDFSDWRIPAYLQNGLLGSRKSRSTSSDIWTYSQRR